MIPTETFHYRHTSAFVELVVKALDRGHSHLHASYAELSDLLGCDATKTRNVVAEAIEQGYVTAEAVFDTSGVRREANAYKLGPQAKRSV